MPCDRWKNALLNAPDAYQTTECSAAARLRCTNDGRRNMNDSTSDTGGAFFFSTIFPPKSAYPRGGSMTVIRTSRARNTPGNPTR